MPESKPLTPEERELCVDFLQRLADDPALVAPDERIRGLISKISRQGWKRQAKIERAERAEREERDRKLRAETAMVLRDLRRQPLALSEASPEPPPRTVLEACVVLRVQAVLAVASPLPQALPGVRGVELRPPRAAGGPAPAARRC